MPLHPTGPLMLRTYPLGESDRIVVFLTRDRGKKRGVAKNARQSRRRFGGALEPMTCGRGGYMERDTRDRGKKRGGAKTARRSRGRSGGAREPMTCGRVGYMERERRDLVTVNYVE